MLDMAQVDQKNVWKFVKQIRKSFLSQLKDKKCQNVKTGKHDGTLIDDSYIKDNNDVIEEKLKLNIKITPNHTVAT